MNNTLVAYFDDLHIITAEIDLHYYNGESAFFKVIDEENKYHDVIIRDKTLEADKRVYTLYVENLVIGGNYYLVDEHFLKTSLQYRYVVRSEAFDQMFYYNGKDLGPSYSEEQTTFKVWAPTASRVMVDFGDLTYDMVRTEKGVHEVTVNGNLDGKSYQYLLNIGRTWHEATDPYALSSTANHERSVVINPGMLKMAMHEDELPKLEKKTDSIIYELHVRDFSMDENSGIENKGKFLGLTETGTHLNGELTGLDYLKSLGITHLQLLPIYDFGSVDELHPTNQYNWGYDPMQYNVPEGSYVTDPQDPYKRISELQTAVSTLHKNGIRVIMDVVYNHMFDRFTSNFENIVPYYYFRMNKDGMVSNGSFCGNDFDSTRKMARKYILDSIQHWMNHYSIDGFRFDLMGILDIETMNQVADLVEKINPQAMVYGEGWNMPTLLDDEQKASMFNQEAMPKIGHFNDLFRDTLKGGSMEDEEKQKGVCTGDLKLLSKLPILLKGSETNFKKENFFSAPWKSINYVECHDNQTLYDKMVSCDIPVEELVLRQKLMLAITIFSQGIPFIHAGQEFCRTKAGHHNSYMLPDAINQIDWQRKVQYESVVQFTRDAIALRKATEAFKVDVYDTSIKAKAKKLKKIIEVNYGKTHQLLINFGSETEIKLKKDKVIFNKHGKCDVTDDYLLENLELIVIEKAQ